MFFSLWFSKKNLSHKHEQWLYCAEMQSYMWVCVFLLRNSPLHGNGLLLCNHAYWNPPNPLQICTHPHICTHTGMIYTYLQTHTHTYRADHVHTAQGTGGYSKSIFSFPSALRAGTDPSCFPLALNMHVSQPFMWATLSCVLCKKSWGYFLILAAHQFFISIF